MVSRIFHVIKQVKNSAQESQIPKKVHVNIPQPNDIENESVSMKCLKLISFHRFPAICFSSSIHSSTPVFSQRRATRTSPPPGSARSGRFPSTGPSTPPSPTSASSASSSATSPNPPSHTSTGSTGFWPSSSPPTVLGTLGLPSSYGALRVQNPMEGDLRKDTSHFGTTTT